MRTSVGGIRPDGAPRRVAVLRALQLGDMLCAVPALRTLREGWPGAKIVLIGLPWARSFVGRFECLLDGFREFPGWPGLPEREPDLARIPEFLAEIQAERYDLAIQLHGSGPVVNEVVALFGAARTSGFALPGGYRPDPNLFIPWPERGLEIRRLLALVEALGLPGRGEHLQFPIREDDRAGLRRLGLPEGAYACVHPGASVEARRWPAGRFAEVADTLVDRGLAVVLTGTAAELELCRSVARMMRGPSTNLAGRTDLGTLAALLEGARLLACNDTGVSHVAAALGTPSVVISTGENPGRWAPIDVDRHRVLCRDAGVEAAEVVAQALGLLGPGAPRPADPEPVAAAPAT